MMPQNVDFRALFNELPKQVQENVTNFFNLHNVAISIYNQLPEDGKSYVDLCIKMTNSLDQQEAEDKKES